MSNVPSNQQVPQGAIPVRLVTEDGSAFYNAAGGSPPSGVTPTALLVTKVTTGGTAVIVVTGPCNGGWLQNGLNATRQGIGATEPFYVDMVGTPGSTDAAAAAQPTTQPIDPGQTFTIPALAAGVNVKVNAATANHVITGEVW